LDEATKRFVREIKAITHVREVRLVVSGGAPVIWTIISAPPFENSPRYQVYEVELGVLRDLDEPMLDFRLINMDEFSQDALEKILPRDGKILLQMDSSR
jgi:hypothetical protein